MDVVSDLPPPAPRQFSIRLTYSGLFFLTACALIAVVAGVLFLRPDEATRQMEATLKHALQSSHSVTASYTVFGEDGIGTLVRSDPSPADLKRLASLLKLSRHWQDGWPGAPHGLGRLEVTFSATPNLKFMFALPDRIYVTGTDEHGSHSELVHANTEFMKAFWTSAGLSHAFVDR